jgi:carbonic anhydrase/acetyltransferase-like protein (isoleucine patch superfamily)
MILPHHGHWPVIPESVFLAPSADIIGEVQFGENCSVWFQAVIRGDVQPIRIGNRTNIQDHAMLHATRRVCPLEIGDDVTIGHRACLHGCRVGNRVLIGMGAILMDEAEIGDDCIIGAGALITKGTQIPAGSLVMGSPAKVVRPLKPEEIAFLLKSSQNYVGDSAEYAKILEDLGVSRQKSPTP